MRSARVPISMMRRPVVSSIRPDMPVLIEPSSARRALEVWSSPLRSCVPAALRRPDTLSVASSMAPARPAEAWSR